MKQKLLKLMLLLAVGMMGVSAWGADVTVTKTMSDISTANKWTTSTVSDVTCYTSFDLDGNITISTTGNPNCGSYWGSDWRLYQNQDGNVIITAKNDVTLKSVTFTYTISNSGTLKDGDTNVASNNAQTISGTSKTYTVGNTSTKTNGQVRISQISVTYTTAAAPEPTISFSVSSKPLLVGQSFTQEATTADITGSVVYQSSNTGVATVNSTTGEVTAVAGGNATITASVAADGIEASYIVTVVEKEDGIYNFTWDLSTNKYSTGENIVEWTNEFAEMTNSGTNATNYLGGDSNNRTSSRFYTNNNLTITPATAVSNIYTITSIEFTATSNGYATTLANSKWTNAVAVVDETKVTVVPIDGTDENSAIIGGTCGFTAVKVYYNATYTRSTASGNYGTLCLPYDATVEGAKLYTIAGKELTNSTVTALVLAEAASVEAGKPYIFKATADDVVATYTGTTYTAAGAVNGLYGTYSAIAAGEWDTYVSGDLYLMTTTNVQAADKASSTLGANRAYIDMNTVPVYDPSAGVKGIRLGFDGTEEATAITELTEKTEATEGVIYNLQGQRMNSLQRGINIVGGKKVLVK